MKLKTNFVLRNVAGTWVVLPLGERNLDFNGMLTLNESGAMLWRKLEQGCDREALADSLTGEYDVSREQAMQDVEEFLNVLLESGCLEAQDM